MGVMAKRVHKPAAVRESEILEAAASCFAAHGYRGVDVQLIADTAGVGKGTVYRYFVNKEALFRAALRHCLDLLRHEVRTASDHLTEPMQRFRAATRAYLAYFDQHPQTIELFIQERAEFRDQETPLYFLYVDEHRDHWLALWRQLMQEGRLRVNDAEAVNRLVSRMLYGFILSRTAEPNAGSLEDGFQELFDIMLHGILRAAPKDST
ncbi:TetR/AcrR family transcriptional regulator [Methylonatrum kenyense]|uniref:TetR/AcrR family transcriptional regulator n=1 Tax=Methylonatrum kenyense TaxID=455253 RepID=UPI0020C0DE0E|nr:TetR/AcrR family transcriptional regulator [Methylonatrum kenyense]MCK8516507.1 TetR/AcrR family transcriptional regulator [Methylonatrum kenyense]